MKLGPILVGVDFSEGSEKAIEQARDLARHGAASLVMAHVCPVPELPAWFDLERRGLEERHDSFAHTQLECAADRLERTRREASAMGLVVQKVLLTGRPARGLLAAARDSQAQLVVVGALGTTRGEGERLGEVAAQVIRAPERRVLVARPGARVRGGYRRVLVATSFTGKAERLVGTALTLSAEDAEIDVMLCWNLSGGGDLPFSGHRGAPGLLRRDIGEQVAAGAERRCEGLFRRARAGGRAHRLLVREARARDGILGQLAAEEYDLVVVGAHGRQVFRRLSLGRTAASVVRRATCSVLVVPYADPAEMGPDDR